MATVVDSAVGFKFRAIPLLLLFSTTSIVPTVQANSEVCEIKVGDRQSQCDEPSELDL